MFITSLVDVCRHSRLAHESDFCGVLSFGGRDEVLLRLLEGLEICRTAFPHIGYLGHGLFGIIEEPLGGRGVDIEIVAIGSPHASVLDASNHTFHEGLIGWDCETYTFWIQQVVEVDAASYGAIRSLVHVNLVPRVGGKLFALEILDERITQYAVQKRVVLT